MTRACRGGLLVTLLSAALLPLPVRAQSGPLQGLDAYITRAMRDWKIPGLAIAVVKDDSVVYAGGFGVRQVGKSARVDAHTLFAVASNTKAFTATLLAMLVQQHRLRWDDPVTKYLPWLQLRDPWVTRELTIRDLLTHRMGYSTWEGDLVWYGSTYPTDTVLYRWRAVPPEWSFRSRFGYSNYGYIAAGRIIEAVTDTSWNDYVRVHLLDPLGMRETTTHVADLASRADVAIPHTDRGDSVVAIPYRPLENASGAAALNSNVTDMARWLRFQLRNGNWNGTQLVDSSVLAETRTPQTLLRLSATAHRLWPSTHFYAYGMGWFLRDYKGRLLVMHDGGMDGMLSQSGFVPEEHLGVVILTNYDDQSLFQALLYRVLDAYLGGSRTDWSQAYLDLRRRGGAAAGVSADTGHAAPALPPQAYVGTYHNDILGDAVVTLASGRLHLEVAAHPGLVASLRHDDHDTFDAPWSDRYLGNSAVTFATDAHGRATSLRFSVRPDFVDPLTYEFKRAAGRN